MNNNYGCNVPSCFDLLPRNVCENVGQSIVSSKGHKKHFMKVLSGAIMKRIGQVVPNISGSKSRWTAEYPSISSMTLQIQSRLDIF